MTIKQLTEIVNGSLTPSNQKLDADLVEISQTEGNVLTTVEDGLLVDTSSLATKIELQEILTTLGVTPPSEWELTNAYILNNYLTYISDGNLYGTLYARKSLGIGESVTIDFQFDTNRISGLMFAADDGTSMEGSYSSECAVIFQDLTSAILIAQQDWNPDYRVYVNDSTIYKATIVRLAKSRVVLSMSDVEGNLLISRDVTIGTADINRVWLSVSLYGNPGDTISYGTNITVTPGGFASSASLDLKVDKEEGKGLSTNDYTTEDKDKVQTIRSYIVKEGEYSASYVRQEEAGGFVTYTIETNNVERQMNTLNSENLNPVKVNSVPLYSLDNNGEYVLTEPDSWVSFNESNYVFPVYHISTIETYYAKGIVTFGAVFDMDGETPIVKIDYSHNVSDVIDDYILSFSPTSFLSTNAIVAHTFESSVKGITKFGTIKIPLNLEQDGMTLQQYLDEQVVNKTTIRVEFALKVGSKETAKECQYGINH